MAQMTINQIKEDELTTLLIKYNFDISRVARKLNVSRQTVYNWGLGYDMISHKEKNGEKVSMDDPHGRYVWFAEIEDDSDEFDSGEQEDESDSSGEIDSYDEDDDD